MERTFKWQDTARKFRKIVLCLTFLFIFGISIGTAAVEVGFMSLLFLVAWIMLKYAPLGG